MVLRPRRLLRHPVRAGHHDRRRISHFRRRKNSLLRRATLTRRRVLALQAPGRHPALLLRAAASHLSFPAPDPPSRRHSLAAGSGPGYPPPMPALILPLMEAARQLAARGALIGPGPGSQTI